MDVLSKLIEWLERGNVLAVVIVGLVAVIYLVIKKKPAWVPGHIYRDLRTDFDIIHKQNIETTEVLRRVVDLLTDAGEEIQKLFEDAEHKDRVSQERYRELSETLRLIQGRRR